MTQENHAARELVLVQLFELPSPMAHVNQILSTGCALARRGVRTHLFCRKTDDRDATTILRNDFGLEPAEELVIHAVAASRRLGALDYRRQLLGCALGASRNTLFYGRHRRHTLQVLKLLRLLRKRTPVVFEFHNLEYELEREKGTARAEKVFAEEARLARDCAALSAISRPLADDLVAAFDYRGRLEVVPDGVDLAAFGRLGRPFTGGAQLRLLYAGSLWPSKGVGTLLDALEQLGDDVALTIVGGNPPEELERLRARAKDLGSRVELTGLVDASEVPHHMARADALLLPAGEEKRMQRYASPLKLFEAMATGLPIVAAPADAYTSILTDGVDAFIAPDSSGAALAQAVRRVQADPAGAVRVGAAAARAAEDYSWERRAERILRLCGAVLSPQHEVAVPGLERQ